MWLAVHVTGRPVHVLNTGSGINAIEASYVLFTAMKELEKKWNGLEVRLEVRV
jgi:acetylornithine deacetylase